MMFVLFLGCTPPPVEEGFVSVQLGEVTASVDDVVTGEPLVTHAESWYASAYGYDAEDANGVHNMMVFISSVEGFECSEIANHLEGANAGSNKDWDPSVIVPPGSCTLTFGSPTYDPGGIEVSLAEGDRTIEAIVSLYCADAEGEWVDGADGWMYDGLMWQANSEAFDLSIEGGADEEFAWSIDADLWAGEYLYDFDYPDVPGEGRVAGEGVASWCGAMGTVGTF